ncbi:cell wall-binding repeat-containing protein [Mobiluncus curtisii]|uniref:cell wall-binding repeat-containing protein n=1 Tax=Mobiluncus curtisii TaxID=2051 RepID=UPI00311A786F
MRFSTRKGILVVASLFFRFHWEAKVKKLHGERHLFRLLGGTCLAVSALAGLVFAGSGLSPAYGQDSDTTPTVESDPTSAVVGFNPGMIISDEVFYNPNTMDPNAIQQFLNTQGRACVPGVDTVPGPNGEPQPVTVVCLKDYVESTPDRPADAYCPAAYQGAVGESAAQIIWKVSQACQVNPQVLLVTLQKEQGLLTRSGKSLKLSNYQKAMGYGCPDTAPCNTQYYGFFNQLYRAAHRFHYYQHHPEKFRHRAGRVNNLLYHPSRNSDGSYKCGTTPVFIENQATAGLYNYTPYTPNAAALAAGGGLGDKCSSYGNRNFYRFFTSWFGSTGSASAIPSLRISGADRAETAVGISARAFAGGSDRVYLARSDKPIDALAGGILTDGPVLLVPVDRPLPATLTAEINRLQAKTVVALGGPGAIPDEVLAAAAQGRETSRIYGPDRYATAIAISHQAFPQGAKRIYIADGVGSDGTGSPDAVVGGTLSDGPVLMVNPSDPETWKYVASEVSDLHISEVVGLGGPGALPQEALTTIAAESGAIVSRLAGADRYGTAATIAAYAYPAIARQDKTGSPISSDYVAYIARGDNFADALVAGALRDGPVLLVPSRTNQAPAPVANYLGSLHPNTIIALGGLGAVHPDTVDAVVAATKSGLH